MNSKFHLFLFFSLVFFSAGSLAEDDQESFTHWDEIVTGLQSDLHTTSAHSSEYTSENQYNMDNIKISVGAGLSFSYLSLAGDPLFESSGLLRGLGLQFGIDLFHPEFQAEGAFRNYSTDSLSESVKAQVREFELRLVHSKPLPHSTLFRLGAGLSARYLDVSFRGENGTATRSDTTPSAVFVMGLGRTFGRNLFIGPDISYRSPFAGESLEQSSFDFHLRANAVF